MSKEALESLPTEALGMGAGSPFPYPIRDEVIQHIVEAMEAE